MAKEMMIIFVYDTEALHKEDDPPSAILYFHPGWVSDQQRASLCGQIIGTCQLLSTMLTCPRIFALQSGKFSIRMYGRYLMAIGTDRNIADWVLEHRANTLSSLISFFHHDLVKLSEIYQEPQNLSAKLYHMFETYLKILMYGGHIFFNTPTLQLPKSASYVFLEAMQLLQNCQQMNHVLGGTILYHNKVVATQLSTDLTKRLILTDPYRIKSPAESILIEFALPLGVQLLKVYITNNDYCILQENASQYQSNPQNFFNKTAGSMKKTSTSKPILSAMKRDQSLIFTTVPEEDTDQHSPINIQQRIKSPDRPKTLNLKTKPSVESRPIPSTPFNLGHTSVCSTPMTEVNKILHQNVMSICMNPEEAENSETNTKAVESELPKRIPENVSINSHVFPINTGLLDKKKSSSMWEIREKLKRFNKRITMRYYSLGLLKLNDDLEIDLEALPKKEAYKTITDPVYPYFKTDGNPASAFLHNWYSQEPLNFLNLDPAPIAINKAGSNTNTEPEWKSAEDLETVWLSPKKKQNPQPFSKEIRKSLTLPLKSLASEQPPAVPENIFSPSNRARNYGGVQLTPLMSKLSMLAMEDRTSSGFCSRDATPSEYKDRFTPNQPNYSFLNSRRKSNVPEEISDDKNLRGSALFICGQQDMVMGLLLEEEVRNCPEIINKLFELCTESLGKLEKQLRHCLETYPGSSGQSDNGESYSYLCMDTKWDSVQRGGPWGTVELGLLTHLRRDFINTNNLTEIILRNDDSIIYGHRCGNTEVFYQQVATSSAAGLPTPADHMGMVPLKARRRLERDHAIILL